MLSTVPGVLLGRLFFFFFLYFTKFSILRYFLWPWCGLPHIWSQSMNQCIFPVVIYLGKRLYGTQLPTYISCFSYLSLLFYPLCWDATSFLYRVFHSIQHSWNKHILNTYPKLYTVMGIEDIVQCSTRQRSQSWSHYNLRKLYLVQEIRGNVIKHTDQDTY